MYIYNKNTILNKYLLMKSIELTTKIKSIFGESIVTEAYFSLWVENLDFKNKQLMLQNLVKNYEFDETVKGEFFEMQDKCEICVLFSNGNYVSFSASELAFMTKCDDIKIIE